jgi:peptidyl-tRNA hydrolase, PTH1 family
VFLIIGLGNPGSQYAGTRHNVGFEVVDLLAEKHNTKFKGGRGEFLKAEFSDGGEEILLIKPLTYMNDSGVAVMEVLDNIEIPLERILIVLDDFQLQLGTVRIRLAGTDGGHNGLASVIYHLQSDRIPRLRCGIRSELMPVTRDEKIDFVLSLFASGEQTTVRTMIQTAGDACMMAATESIEQAMNRFNTTSV